jgi:hypothetical protein
MKGGDTNPLSEHKGKITQYENKGETILQLKLTDISLSILIPHLTPNFKNRKMVALILTRYTSVHLHWYTLGTLIIPAS